MKRVLWMIPVLAVAVLFMANGVNADELKVGETWVFKHEGARPMGPPNENFDGDRVREVVSTEGESEKKVWVIKEIWGENDNRVSYTFVNAKKMISKVEVGENRNAISFEPAIPMVYTQLKPDEEKTYKSNFSWQNGPSIPMTIKAKRLKNETVKVPAGEYKDCIHAMLEETITFTTNSGESMTIYNTREVWYHMDVNGMVKETFTTKRPNSDQQITGTSLLKSYSKEKKE